MTKERGINPNHESMFVGNAPDELVERDFSADGVAVSLLESNLQTLHVLNIFSKINQQRNFIEVPRFTARHRDPQASIEGAIRNQNDHKREAMMEFGRSLGLFALEDSGLVDDMTPYRQDVRARWEIFREAFAAPAKSGQRREYVRWLRAEMKALQTSRTTFNRKHGLRPHAPDGEEVKRHLPEVDEQETTPVTNKLTTQARVQAIYGDPRAGFIPATHHEKNQVLLYLDYQDNPAYPLGINNQFFEVFIHNQRIAGPYAGLETSHEAMVSIAHELIDSFTDATHTIDYLREVERETQGIKPTLPINEFFERGDPALGMLIRYRDGMRYLKTGQSARGIRDPLTTKEDRQPHFGFAKNKTLTDVYTNRKRPVEVDAYIAEETDGWTIKDLRKHLTGGVLANERARQDFWAQRMLEFAATSDNKFMPMWQIVEPVLREHGYVQ